jgi:hypothetical protein
LYGDYGPSATIFSTVIILVFEITQNRSEIREFSMFAAPIIQAIMVVMTPITYFFAPKESLY